MKDQPSYYFVDTSFEPEEVKQWLNNIQKGAVIGCTRLTTAQPIKNKYALRALIVSIKPGVNCNVFLASDFVLYQRVSWSRFVARAATQCFKCQRFGHGSSNCLNNFRCVKCPDNHAKGECKRDQRAIDTTTPHFASTAMRPDM